MIGLPVRGAGGWRSRWLEVRVVGPLKAQVVGGADGWPVGGSGG